MGWSIYGTITNVKSIPLTVDFLSLMLYYPNLSMDTPITPWHRTIAGRIFLIVLGSLAFILFLFAALTGYYLWRFSRGDRAELQTIFSNQFTFDPSKSASDNKLTVDPNTVIRAYSPAVGAATAPVTIIEFIDFQCPFCQASWPIFEKAKERFGPAIRVVFKHIPVTQIHDQALTAHLASACADEQGKFWQYEKEVFTTKKLDADSLKSYADTLQLDTTAFDKCLQTKKYLKNIETDIRDAADLGVRGTPTYFVNGQKLEGAVPEDVWQKIILGEIKK